MSFDGIAFFAVRIDLTEDPENSTIPLNFDSKRHLTSLAVHATLGGLALHIGPFQYLTWLRVR